VTIREKLGVILAFMLVSQTPVGVPKVSIASIAKSSLWQQIAVALFAVSADLALLA
jgi:hypothetical protein